jgi:murein DD-endopeptidase MepM/ murein hydrolase activator NlpD
VACVAVLAGVTTAAYADTEDDKREVDAKVESAEDDLHESSDALREAAKALDAAKVGIPKAERELKEARTELRAAEQVEQVILEQVRDAQAKVAREQAKVDAVLAAMENTRQTIGSIARSVYTQGPYAQVEVVLESQDPGDFAERLQSVRTVVKGQDRALAGMAEQRADLQQRTRELEAAKIEVEKRRKEATEQRKLAEGAAQAAAAAKAQIDTLVAARRVAMAVAKKEKSATQARLRELRDEQARLASLLAGPGTGARYPSGSLIWPANGPTSGQVGPRIHPVYGYASCHTGIDISAGSGSPIWAAAAGTVVSTASGGPYGNHTVISHGDGLSTMYAHQSRFAASAGQKVAKGEVIGYVGSTGYSSGPHLHFEVWVGGVPYNPLGWFGGARVPIAC